MTLKAECGVTERGASQTRSPATLRAVDQARRQCRTVAAGQPAERRQGDRRRTPRLTGSDRKTNAIQRHETDLSRPSGYLNAVGIEIDGQYQEAILIDRGWVMLHGDPERPLGFLVDGSDAGHHDIDQIVIEHRLNRTAVTTGGEADRRRLKAMPDRFLGKDTSRLPDYRFHPRHLPGFEARFRALKSIGACGVSRDQSTAGGFEANHAVTAATAITAIVTSEAVCRRGGSDLSPAISGRRR